MQPTKAMRWQNNHNKQNFQPLSVVTEAIPRLLMQPELNFFATLSSEALRSGIALERRGKGLAS